VSHTGKEHTGHSVRGPTLVREAVSAVRISESLTAEIDAWAETHGTSRSDAIRRLIEIGLNSQANDKTVYAVPTDPFQLANLAARQIERLLDPSLSSEERERRIRRLVEGPPEFSAERLDLPKPGE